MKHVFSNSQLAHVWASQSQESGRNANGSMFFDGNTMYSYGRHYAMATIHKDTNGNKLVLVNEHRYSMTTGRQRSDVLDAIRGTRYIMVPDVTSLRNEANLTYLYNELVNSMDNGLNHRKLWFNESDVTDSLANLNRYLDFTGKPLVQIESVYFDAIKEIGAIRSVKQIEKQANRTERQRVAAIQYEEQRKQHKIEQTELVQLWLKGEIVQKSIQWSLFNDQFPTDIIRLKPNDSSIVETNRGAEVPLKHAARLLKLVLNKQVKQGERVGHFTVDDVQDSTLTIGCHTIDIKQASQVLMQYITTDSVNERMGS